MSDIEGEKTDKTEISGGKCSVFLFGLPIFETGGGSQFSAFRQYLLNIGYCFL